VNANATRRRFRWQPERPPDTASASLFSEKTRSDAGVWSAAWSKMPNRITPVARLEREVHHAEREGSPEQEISRREDRRDEREAHGERDERDDAEISGSNERARDWTRGAQEGGASPVQERQC
jgi:hypothetical protein